MKKQRVQLTDEELVDSLKQNSTLLAEFLEKGCRQGDEKFFGEIAGKLRVLVYQSRTNIPLLLGLAEKFHIPLTLDFDKPGGHIQMTLQQYLDSLACVIGIGSELVSISVKQFIAMWSQQMGASHQDWQIDEELSAIRKQGIFVGNLPVSGRALCAMGENILFATETFLKEYEKKPASAGA